MTTVRWGAASPSLSTLSLLTARKLARQLHAEPDPARAQLHVRVAGNANVDHTVELLALGLSMVGVDARTSAASFDAWSTDSFDGDPPDVWLLWISAAGATRGGAYAPRLHVEDVLGAVRRVRAQGARPVVVLPELAPAELDPYSVVTIWRRGFNAELGQELAGLGVPALSLDHLVAVHGLGAWASSRYWESARLPCHPERLPAAVEEISATIARTLQPRVRGIAVDLDDTLWGGLVGEVGPEGLDLDPFGSGRAYLELQTLLQQARAQGVPLCVVSKNDPEQAVRPFRERSEMVLRLDDVSFFAAGWDAKHRAIAEFAREVNVGVDTICFLDDSPFERDQAASQLPGLIVPDLPAEPSRRVPFLLAERLLLRPVTTAEDRIRADFVSRGAQRSAEVDDEAYLRGLEMVLRPKRLAGQGLDRAAELIAKTNQFNVTLARTSQARLAALLQGQGNYAYSFALEDRLGPAGDISVLVAERTGAALEVREWVMSCRVFSRGVEWAVLGHLLQWAQDKDVAELTFPFVPGPRNGMVRELLEGLQLSCSRADDRWVFSGWPARVPYHVVRTEEFT